MTNAVEAARVALDAAREEQAKAQGYHARKVAEAEQALADAQAGAPVPEFGLPLVVEVPLGGDEYAEDVVADMVGKQVHLSEWYDWSVPLGKGTIESADLDEENLTVRVTMSEETMHRVARHFGGEPNWRSIGFRIVRAKGLDDEGHKRYEVIEMLEVALGRDDDETSE